MKNKSYSGAILKPRLKWFTTKPIQIMLKDIVHSVTFSNSNFHQPVHPFIVPLFILQYYTCVRRELKIPSVLALFGPGGNLTRIITLSRYNSDSCLVFTTPPSKHDFSNFPPLHIIDPNHLKHDFS